MRYAHATRTAISHQLMRYAHATRTAISLWAKSQRRSHSVAKGQSLCHDT
ncbi:MAG: hypothetical protein F6K65_44260 [Moorea sp. SIO3C2]|nr:hypothetical protein [Moorena sp. SIO3C2]